MKILRMKTRTLSLSSQVIITNKFWRVLSFLYFPSLLLRWCPTDRNMEVGDVCAYRGELTLFDYKSYDAFEDDNES